MKTFSPYLRKHVLGSLSAHEYLLLNTIVVGILVMLTVVYEIVFSKESVGRLLTQYKKLTVTQLLCVIGVGSITVASSFVIMNLDKNYKSPLINSVLLKTCSTVLLLITGIFLFEESYSMSQLLGIVLAVVGAILLLKE